tara:strand:+ start:9456 stop:10967 length:1512 start_codon:yes stop_codon:yes gene_type:complete
MIYSSALLANDCVNCPKPQVRSTEVFNTNSIVSSSCYPLSVGQSKIIDSQNEPGSENRMTTKAFSFEYPVPADSRYLLTRTGGNEYELAFNIQFNPTAATSLNGDQMLSRLQTCIELANPFLKGPAGEKIRLSVNKTSNSNLPTPPLVVINLVGKGARSNAGNFAEDAGCSTLVHEMFHHAGLCDEYLEKDEAMKPTEGECRFADDIRNLDSLSPMDSLMHKHGIVFDAYVGDQKFCRFSDTSNARELKQKMDLNPLYQEMIMQTNLLELNSSAINYGYPKGHPQADKSALQVFCQKEFLNSGEKNNSEIKRPFLEVLKNEDERVEVTEMKVWNAISESKLWVGKTRLNCDCSSLIGSDKRICLQFLEEMKFRVSFLSDPEARSYRCPAGTSEESVDSGVLSLGEIQVSQEGIKTRSKPIEVEGDTLLYPAQFYRLISGECEQNTGLNSSQLSLLQNYNACARFTRRVSRKRHTGAPSEDYVDSCSQRPEYCFDPKLWLGEKN